jgi:hypothetical protein
MLVPEEPGGRLDPQRPGAQGEGGVAGGRPAAGDRGGPRRRGGLLRGDGDRAQRTGRAGTQGRAVAREHGAPGASGGSAGMTMTRAEYAVAREDPYKPLPQ